MKERDQLIAEEQKRQIIADHGFACIKCGAPAIFLAHRIAKTKANLRKYGQEVIHHRYNLLPVCSNSGCNSAQNLGNRPMEADKLAAQIRKHIESVQTLLGGKDEETKYTLV